MIGTAMNRLVPADWKAAYQGRCDMIRAGEGKDLAGKLFEGVIRSKAGEDIAVEISFSVWADSDRLFVTRAMRDVRGQLFAERPGLPAHLVHGEGDAAVLWPAGGRQDAQLQRQEQ